MIKRYSHLGSLVLLFLFLFFGCGEEAGRNLHTKAQEALRSGDPVRARILLEKAIRKSVPVAEKREMANQLGIILWELNEPEEALAAFTQATELSETHNAATLNRASALIALGEYDEAEILLNNLAVDAAYAAQAQGLLCSIEIERGHWQRAEKSLLAASDLLAHQPSLLVAAAHIDLYLHHDPRAAKQRLTQALHLDPASPIVHYNLAVLHECWLRDYVAAQSHYQAYIDHQSIQSAYLTEAQEAHTRLEQANQRPQKKDPLVAKEWLRKGAEAYNQKKYEQAIDCFNTAIQADPQAESSHYNLALAYYHLSAYTSAQLAFEEVLKINPTFTDAHYMLTITLLKAGKLDEAEAAAIALAALDAKRGTRMLEHISRAR